MAIQLRLAFGAACAIAPLLMIGSALGQVKRPWIDPPAETGATVRPASPINSRAAAPPADRTEPSAVGSPASVAPVPVPAPTHTAAPQAGQAAAAKPASKARVLSKGPARAKAPVREAKSVRSSTVKPRVATRGTKARSEQDGRVLESGRTLELMTLKTIQLPDGRRLTVLTEPDQQTIEDFLPRP